VDGEFDEGAHVVGHAEHLLRRFLDLLVAARHVGDLDDEPDARRCLELRECLGIDSGPGSRAFVRPDGAPIAAGELRRWLRTASLIRISLEVNGGICRSLLEHRYALSSREEVAA